MNANGAGVVAALGEVPGLLYWREGYQVNSLPKALTAIALCLEGFLASTEWRGNVEAVRELLWEKRKMKKHRGVGGGG